MNSPSQNHIAQAHRLCRLLALLCLGHFSAHADLIIYTNALNSKWQNWSWATVNLANTSPAHSQPYSISVIANNVPTNWEALYLDVSAMDVSSYTNLTFWIDGGAGGQTVQVQAMLNGNPQAAISVGPLPANQWERVNCSLAALGAANQSSFTGFWIQGVGGSPLPAFYVDDIVLQSGASAPPPTNALVTVNVDAQANRHPISPLIYGVAFAGSNDLNTLNFTMNRSGGNSETRYNWQINAHNLANDWYFESYPDASAVAAATADDHVANSDAGGAQPMITVPMIGWMPILGSDRAIIPSYSVAKYGAQTGTDPYLPNAGNGISAATGAAITNNDPNDANFPTNSAFQQFFVQHLLGRWGASTNGGVRYYIMDNEHSIWFSTHQDVHPIGPTMEEILGKILDYASMVKANDPNALVCAPEEFGWSGYFFSGFDQQWSGQHGDYNTADFPDRAANGGWDYMPWLLNQLHQHETNTGQRLLDYFTLHCYPQEGSVGTSATDAATVLLRNASTRQFWDTTYVDPSWINSVIMLIPRMKNWVTNYYPGTKIGVTEYNWGAEPDISGATAQADILGIFGREGLDLSTRWTTPDPSTPTYLAMKIYRNYDGSKSTFGDTSVSATGPNPDYIATFAATRSTDGALTIMAINKQIGSNEPAIITLTNFLPSGIAHVWQLTSANVITNLTDLAFTGGTLSNTLPAQSITLFVLPAGTPPSLQSGVISSTNTFSFLLNGQTNQHYAILTSSNLLNWQTVQTNSIASSPAQIILPATNTAMFYRAQWLP